LMTVLVVVVVVVMHRPHREKITYYIIILWLCLHFAEIKKNKQCSRHV